MSGDRPARVRTPEFDAAVARLRERGHSASVIAKCLGCSISSVKRSLYPARVEYERQYSRDRQRRGICIDCGTTISSNASYPAKRCTACHMRNVVHPARALARLDSGAAEGDA